MPGSPGSRPNRAERPKPAGPPCSSMRWPSTYCASSATASRAPLPIVVPSAPPRSAAPRFQFARPLASSTRSGNDSARLASSHCALGASSATRQPTPPTWRQSSPADRPWALSTSPLSDGVCRPPCNRRSARRAGSQAAWAAPAAARSRCSSSATAANESCKASTCKARGSSASASRNWGRPPTSAVWARSTTAPASVDASSRRQGEAAEPSPPSGRLGRPLPRSRSPSSASTWRQPGTPPTVASRQRAW